MDRRVRLWRKKLKATKDSRASSATTKTTSNYTTSAESAKADNYTDRQHLNPSCAIILR